MLVWLSLFLTPKQTTLKQLYMQVCVQASEKPTNTKREYNQQQFQLTDEIRITPTH